MYIYNEKMYSDLYANKDLIVGYIFCSVIDKQLVKRINEQ